MCVTIEKLLSGYRHDTILKFEDEEIKTHKEILCDNSEFFRTFYAKWDKDKNGVMCMLLVHSYTLSYRDNDDNHAGIYQKLIVDGKQVAFTGDYENLFR